MRSILTRVETFGVAAILAASLALPASAATRHKRAAAAPTPYEYSTGGVQNPQAAAHPDAPAMVRDQALSCFTDEGYGRFASCDGSGF